MKVIIKYVMSLAIIIMASCNNKSEQPFIENENIVLITLDDEKKLMVKKNDYGTYLFDNWNEFNISNVRLHQIESVDFDAPITRISTLESSIVNLDATIPKWIESKNVLEDIKNIQEEFDTLLDERYKSTTKIRENWEDLSEKFDDLREELNETVEGSISE